MTNGTRFLHYVQLLDSALPIGSFSHSFGLETIVEQGFLQTPKQLEPYMSDLTRSSLAPMEGLSIQLIYKALQSRDYKQVVDIDFHLHVQRTSRESREAAFKMGKRLLKLAETLYPWMDFSPLKSHLAQSRGFGTLPTIHAWICYQLGLGCDEAVTGYLYTSVVTLVNSALRLMSIGQTEGQLVINRLIAVIEQTWQDVKNGPVQEPHSFAIAQEIHAMNHENLYSRLFMS